MSTPPSQNPQNSQSPTSLPAHLRMPHMMVPPASTMPIPSTSNLQTPPKPTGPATNSPTQSLPAPSPLQQLQMQQYTDFIQQYGSLENYKKNLRNQAEKHAESLARASIEQLQSDLHTPLTSVFKVMRKKLNVERRCFEKKVLGILKEHSGKVYSKLSITSKTASRPPIMKQREKTASKIKGYIKNLHDNAKEYAGMDGKKGMVQPLLEDDKWFQNLETLGKSLKSMEAEDDDDDDLDDTDYTPMQEDDLT